MNGEDRELEATLELLREAHRQPIAEAHFAAVRARVLSDLARERRIWRRRWSFGFAAAVAVILVSVFWPRHRVASRPTVPTVEASHEVTQALPPVRASDSTPRFSKRRRSVASRVVTRATYQMVGPAVSKPLVVKLITNDPDVVIYWISGE